MTSVKMNAFILRLTFGQTIEYKKPLYQINHYLNAAVDFHLYYGMVSALPYFHIFY